MRPDWRLELARRGAALEDRLDSLRWKLRQRAGGSQRLQILPYRAFGNGHTIYFHGRVLLERRAAPAPASGLQNALAIYRRFTSLEVPGRTVRISYAGTSAETVTDREGYFHGTLPRFPTPGDFQRPLLHYDLPGTGITAQSKLFLPSSSARFGVISDIDDTVLVSHATNLPKMVLTLLLHNARGRVAFPGVAAWYRALRGAEDNPFFYVSSGPWNLYDLLVDFFEINGLPAGPVFLQDYGFDRDRFISPAHHQHKREQIDRLLQAFPDLPFILIGDSSQQDPEIYAEALQNSANRILAIYIRDVTRSRRDTEVRELARQVTGHGGELVYVQDSLEAAWHALERGWIRPEDFSEIDDGRREDLELARNDP